MIVDFHTHAFPDEVAAQAIPALEHQGRVTARLDGRVDSLLASMDRSGIDQSVLCSIATRPSQFEAILSWSESVRSARLVPLPSVHPDDPEAIPRLARISRDGFVGIKLHPYYQRFMVDEERMFPLYEAIIREKLFVVMHTGFDIGFPRERIADPARLVRVIEKFPELRLVTTHFGSWDMWDEVEKLLIGRPVYMDVSYSLEFLEREQARRMLLAHPREYLLFGSDSPWDDQAEALARLTGFNLGEERRKAILGGNAVRLLGKNERDCKS